MCSVNACLGVCVCMCVPVCMCVSVRVCVCVTYEAGDLCTVADVVALRCPGMSLHTQLKAIAENRDVKRPRAHVCACVCVCVYGGERKR